MQDLDSIADLIVCEQTSPLDNTVTSMDVRKVGNETVARFDTNLQSFEIINRNGRMYLGDNIWDRIVHDDEIQTCLRGNRWFGEMDHPFNRIETEKLSQARMRKVDMSNRSHVIINPRIKGNLLKATIESSCNDVGKGFRDEVLRGMIPAFSCRAVARMERRNNKPTVIVGKLVTYDWVLYESHPEAEGSENLTVKRVGGNVPITESASSNFKTLGDVIVPVDALNRVAEKDKNVNFIMEACNLSNDDLIGYNSLSKRVVIGDRNTRIFAKLSQKSIATLEDALSMY
nr:MAG TPA: Prohead core protein serine protease [Caudoviricetes sp.]